MRKRFGEAALPFGLILTGLALVLTLPLWDKLPLVFNNTGQYFTSFAAREATRGGIAFIVLAIPTVFMGLTFRCSCSASLAHSTWGGGSGRLTTVNTLGAVFGSLLTGYVLLPALGSERSLFVVALVFVAAGLLTTRFITGRARVTAYALSVGSALIWLVAPRWDLARLTAGTNVYFDGWAKPDQVPFVRDDIHGGITTVTKLGDVYTLYTNGKFQGNTGWEMHAQRFFAHYPSIFVTKFDQALIIGLGTGTTLGTIAAYPWKKLELVEISPAIVEAADQYFRSANNGSIHDPRLTLHLGDGRNFPARRAAPLRSHLDGADQHLVRGRGQPVQPRVLSPRAAAPGRARHLSAVGAAAPRHAQRFCHRRAHAAQRLPARGAVLRRRPGHLGFVHAAAIGVASARQ